MRVRKLFTSFAEEIPKRKYGNMPKHQIEISAKHKALLAEEFNVTPQHIRFCLKGYADSQKATEIRERAKELLIEEAKKIEA